MRIDINGVIVANDERWIYEWLEMDCVSPNQVQEQIDKANGEALEVYINSPGGCVFSGSTIYSALMEYMGNVTVKITGIAASIASVIAMAGRKVLISPTAEIMIHNISSVARGDHRRMEHEAMILRDYNSTIANAYEMKSGMSKAELLKLMDAESWITPEQALAYKLVDGIMFTDDKDKQTEAQAGLEALRNKPTTDARATLEALKRKTV